MKREDLARKLAAITPERRLVARIFKDHIERAIDELGPGYVVDFQGQFDTTPIRITLEISSEKRLRAKIEGSDACAQDPGLY